MGYLPREDLEAMGFAKLGRNVKISDRAAIYDAERISIGDNSRIDDFCVVSGKLQIGRNVFIGAFGLIAGGQLGIVFEDFTTLAYRVSVFTQSDDYSGRTMTNSTVPKEYKDEKKAPVNVRRHTIIGAGASILPGVTLAEGSSVGAHSLILHDTDPWTIVAGVPAHKLGDRRKDLLALEHRLLAAENRGAE